MLTSLNLAKMVDQGYSTGDPGPKLGSRVCSVRTTSGFIFKSN